MKYIESFEEGQSISGIYLCKTKNSATTKNGKTYENVILQDKTGTVDAKIWEPNSAGIYEFDAMDYVYINAEVTSFNGAKQLNIRQARQASEGEYVTADYFPVSDKDIEVMFDELLTYITSVENPFYRKLLGMFFMEDEEFIRSFKCHSAAKSVHHGFIGGLLEHTLSVTKLCDFYCKNYSILNRDLLITAAILHDMGKVDEISEFPGNDYTDDGQLIGHIVIGSEKIAMAVREIPGFPPKMSNELRHCILAHHGELEYGSPKKPALVEAMALNFADNTDAKLQTMTEIFDKHSNAGSDEWLGYDRLFESNLRKSTR